MPRTLDGAVHESASIERRTIVGANGTQGVNFPCRFDQQDRLSLDLYALELTFGQTGTDVLRYGIELDA